ncbi:MAG: hypothetical protein WCQ50_19745 [Spirochaetota bacterium]
MAEYGEWNSKGASLSETTAQKEYGVTRDFLYKGMKSGDLEYRQGAIWGNPYYRILRSQLEAYITKNLGKDHLVVNKKQEELRTIKKEIAMLNKKLKLLQERKKELDDE